MNSQDRFEAWATAAPHPDGYYWTLSYDSDSQEYISDDTQSAWLGWQAAQVDSLAFARRAVQETWTLVRGTHLVATAPKEVVDTILSKAQEG